MIVELIPPENDDVDRLITCEGCGIEYSYEHYKILADLNKLAYFCGKEVGITCHTCLFLYGRFLAETSDKECYKIEVIAEDDNHILKFHKNA